LKFIWKVAAGLICTCILFLQVSPAYAGEIDDFIIVEENLATSTKKNPVYTQENVKNGIINIPSGTYHTITVSYNLKNIVMNLDNVTVNDRIILFGSNKKKATIVVSGNTKIGTVFTKRNLTLIDSSEKRHVGTVEVKGTNTNININAVTKSVLLLRDSNGATVTVNKNCKSINDLGTENKIITYAPVNKVNITGENSSFTALENVTNTFVSGYGNRVSIKCNVFGNITSSGAKTLIVGQTENNKPIDMKGIEITGGSYMLIRKEQLCAVTDSRTDAQKVSELVNKNVLFIGDSFIERLYTRGLLKTNMAALCAYGSAPGDWYLDGQKHLDYFNELLYYNPDKIVYYYGVNAIYDANNEEYSERLLTDLMGRYPAATIYVQKIFPLANNSSGVGQYDYDDYNHKAEYSIDRYNNELEQFCKKYTNLVWCDTTAEFLDGNGDLKRSKTVDGLHLSTEACKEWMNAIKKIIKE
jgi:lysophospholipase L1-like esterase